MNKKGHWIFGIILCLFFIFLTRIFGLKWFEINFSSVLIMLGLITFYSILPDIDHKSGTMTWWFLGISIIGLITGLIVMIFNFNISLILIIISTFLLIMIFISTHWFSHRGFIHTIWVGFLSIIPIYFLFNSIAYCFIGYLAWHSHLIADGYVFKIK